MKRIILSFAVLLAAFQLNAKTALVTNIEPLNWFTGMKDASLQIVLTGKGIRQADVTTDYPGVRIDSLVRLDSENYLFVYLDIKDAKPGVMPLTVKKDKKKEVVPFQLLARTVNPESRKGFSNKDVLYMLMPDRFAQGHKDNANVPTKEKYVIDRTEPSLRHGGDLEGIRQHLDYFNQLGVTALWFTPVLENDSPDSDGHSTYHGYATTNYYRIDPRFGTNDEYKQLVEEAHQHGLKMVMDMIFNHCGFEHPWVKDMPSKDWFNYPEWLAAPKTTATTTAEGQSTTYAGGLNDLYLQTSYKLTPVVDPYASKVDLKETCDGWFVPSMPDLNQRNPHVMKYLTQNSIWWIETANIDGIRMDTYPYADSKGMAQWMKRINMEYPDFNVVGESWVLDPAYTAALQKGAGLSDCNTGVKGFDTQLKTVMDFSFFDRMGQAKNEQTEGDWIGLNRIYSSFVYDYLYPNPKSVLAFLENHDTDRYLGKGKDTNMLKQGLALLLTINRIPQLYYGTEVLMNGTKEVTDGNVRLDFPGGFPGDARNAFTKEGRTAEENAMFEWISKLLHWRQKNNIVTEGRQIQFIPKNGVYIIAHVLESRYVLTVLNGTDKAAEVDWQRYQEVAPAGTVARDVVTGTTYTLGGKTTLTPRQTLILEY